MMKIFRNLFKQRKEMPTTDGFLALTKTERYIQSIYKIQKVNGLFGLLNTKSGAYVDLLSPYYEWRYGTTHTKDCFGSKQDVLRVFNYKDTLIEEINVESTY